jgi:hypothetical protein
MKKVAMMAACVGSGVAGGLVVAMLGAGRLSEPPRAVDFGFVDHTADGTKQGWETARAFPVVAEAAPGGGFVVVITPYGTGMVVTQDGTATPIVMRVAGTDGGVATAVPNLRASSMKDPAPAK